MCLSALYILLSSLLAIALQVNASNSTNAVVLNTNAHFRFASCYTVGNLVVNMAIASVTLPMNAFDYICVRTIYWLVEWLSMPKSNPYIKKRESFCIATRLHQQYVIYSLHQYSIKLSYQFLYLKALHFILQKVKGMEQMHQHAISFACHN